MPIEYKYNEKQILEELLEYINGTYEEHYGGDIQTVEYLISKGRGLDYVLGNNIKYTDRYGKKYGYLRKDLLKSAHYIIMALFIDSKMEKENDV